MKHQRSSQPGLPLLPLFLQQVVAGENAGCTSLKPVVVVCLFIKAIQCLGKTVRQLRQSSRSEYVVIAASKLAAQAPTPCQGLCQGLASAQAAKWQFCAQLIQLPG